MRGLTEKTIEAIAKAVRSYIEEEQQNGDLTRLENSLKGNTKSIQNLMEVLKKGKATDLILEQLEVLQNEKIELERQIENEKSYFSDYSYDEIKNHLMSIKNFDYTKIEYRKKLIDIFIREIILNENKLTILYNINGNNKKEQKNGSKYKSSYLERMVEIVLPNPNPFCFEVFLM